MIKKEKQESFGEFPEVIRDSLSGRIFRYRNNLDLYRIEKVNMLEEGGCGIVSLVTYNLILRDRREINHADFERLEFVDRTSKQLSQALSDFFEPNRRKLE